jgi:hypothetical protein
MKKLLFALMAVGLMASASSCKKCGYCQYGGGQGNSSAVCRNNTFPGVGDSYKEAEADCQAQGGQWVVTK